MFWTPKRTNAGNVAIKVLLSFVATCALVTWAYFHFVKFYHLENPTKHLTFVADPGSEITNLYRKRMIKDCLSRTENAGKQTLKLYKSVANGKYDGDRDAFRQDRDEILMLMLAAMEQIKGQTCPENYRKAHIKAAQGLSDLYFSLRGFEEAYGLEGELREQAIEAAKKLYRQGNKRLSDAKKTYGTL